MDFYNIDYTLSCIEKIDKKLIDEMDNITFEYNKLSKEGDKLLQILNYSPKVAKPDRNAIKNLPKVIIPQLSELKYLDFSQLTSTSDNRNISSDLNEQEKKDMVKSIITSIIDNSLGNNENNHIKTEEDEDEVFRKLLKKKKNSENDDKSIDNELKSSKLGLEMALYNPIKVYLFNNNDYISINITPNDKIKSIKEKIIQKIIDNKKYTLKSTSEDAYEIRIIDEDIQDKFVIGSSPLENDESIFKEKISSVAFLEKQNCIVVDSMDEDDEIKIEDEKINIKIYYKKNGLKNSKIFVLSKDDILKTVLNQFFEQDILSNKNIEQYYFVEHNAIQDIDNEINLDTNIKYLPTYELNLCVKDYFELHDIINEYSNLKARKNSFDSFKGGIKNSVGVSRFNEISGGLYQEFEVYKINKYKTKKKRILGIDMYYLYNNLPKKSNSGIMNILFKETKHPMRKMENVKECGVIGNYGFFIDIKEEDTEQIKQLKYETKNTEVREEIIDKINFLINYHKNNNE